MARSDAATPEEYLEELPEDRREIISAVREVILENLPEGDEKTMNWGTLSYEIPLDVVGESVADTPPDEPIRTYDGARRG